MSQDEKIPTPTELASDSQNRREDSKGVKAAIKTFENPKDEEVNEFLKTHKILRDGLFLQENKIRIMYFVGERELPEPGFDKEGVIDVISYNVRETQNRLLEQYQNLRLAQSRDLKLHDQKSKAKNADERSQFEANIEQIQMLLRVLRGMAQDIKNDVLKV